MRENAPDELGHAGNRPCRHQRQHLNHPPRLDRVILCSDGEDEQLHDGLNAEDGRKRRMAVPSDREPRYLLLEVSYRSPQVSRRLIEVIERRCRAGRSLREADHRLADLRRPL